MNPLFFCSFVGNNSFITVNQIKFQREGASGGLIPMLGGPIPGLIAGTGPPSIELFIIIPGAIPGRKIGGPGREEGTMVAYLLRAALISSYKLMETHEVIIFTTHSST